MNFKTEIQCSQCHEHWMVGDRERTPEEKRIWVCPKCQGKDRYKFNPHSEDFKEPI